MTEMATAAGLATAAVVGQDKTNGPDPTPESAQQSKTSLRKARAAALITLLAERFPKCFSVFERDRKLLKVGIDRDIVARAPDIAEADLAHALRLYTGNVHYLALGIVGAPRFDLDGNEAGTVTPDQAEATAARHAIALRRRAARRQARLAQKAPPPTITSSPKRDGLAALKAAAQARREGKS